MLLDNLVNAPILQVVLVVQVVNFPVVAQRRSMVSRTIEIPQLPLIRWSMVLLFWSCEFHSCRLWRRQPRSHSCSSLNFARSRRHSCRDAEAVSHGSHCLADQRDYPVALRQGRRCPFRAGRRVPQVLSWSKQWCSGVSIPSCGNKLVQGVLADGHGAAVGSDS